MRNSLVLLFVFYLVSCAPMYSTLELTGNEKQILQALNDQELRKGKIFVLSQTQNGLLAWLDVNGEIIEIRDQELQMFELKKGENSIYTYLTLSRDGSGLRVYNCNKEPYIFNAEAFPKDQTHYFVIVENIRHCYMDIHVKEEGFFYSREHPRSIWKLDWRINK